VPSNILGKLELRADLSTLVQQQAANNGIVLLPIALHQGLLILDMKKGPYARNFVSIHIAFQQSPDSNALSRKVEKILNNLLHR
jgi:hypothetical protein